MATKQVKKTTAKQTSTIVTQGTDQYRSTVESINTNLDSVQSFAKKAYFAGLGALGLSVEEITNRYTNANKNIQDRYAQINNGGKKFVNDLVNRGEKVQDEAQDILQERRDTFRASVNEQIEMAKTRLGGLVSVVDIPARLQEVSDRIESLSKDLKKSA